MKIDKKKISYINNDNKKDKIISFFNLICFDTRYEYII